MPYDGVAFGDIRSTFAMVAPIEDQKLPLSEGGASTYQGRARS